MKANAKRGSARKGVLNKNMNVKVRTAARWVGDKTDRGVLCHKESGFERHMNIMKLVIADRYNGTDPDYIKAQNRIHHRV